MNSDDPLTPDDRERLLVKISEMRDALRPEMDDVLRVLRMAFETGGVYGARNSLLVDGPEQWVWEDQGMKEFGLGRYIILGRSTDVAGYPLMTIRQSYSVRLDTWVTTSGLVTGDNDIEIARSITNHIAVHRGSMAGCRLAMTAMILAGGDPSAGLEAADQLTTQINDIELRDPRDIVQGMTPDPSEVN